jgi:hypothetical protein
MHQFPVNLDATAGIDPALAETFAIGTETIEMLCSRQDHPASDLAAHALDLHLAAARVIALSRDDAVNMAGWSDAMSHVCDMHLYAAVYLLACSAGNGADGAREMMVGARDVVAQLLAP